MATTGARVPDAPFTDMYSLKHIYIGTDTNIEVVVAS